MTDKDRAEWVETTLENHYNAWQESGLSIEEYVNAHRAEIDADSRSMPGTESLFRDEDSPWEPDYGQDELLDDPDDGNY